MQPGLPRLFLFGLSERSERAALSELRQSFLYTQLPVVWLAWPTPLNVVFIISYRIYLVCVKERSASIAGWTSLPAWPTRTQHSTVRARRATRAEAAAS